MGYEGSESIKSESSLDRKEPTTEYLTYQETFSGEPEGLVSAVAVLLDADAPAAAALAAIPFAGGTGSAGTLVLSTTW